MSSNSQFIQTWQNIYQQPFLPNQRNFPSDAHQLKVELTKSYTDIARAINNRQIGGYELFQTSTGQYWFNDGEPQNKLQAFRQVYKIPAPIQNGSGTVSINHGITVNANTQFTNIYGVATNNNVGTPVFWLPLPWVKVINPSDPNDNIGLEVTTTQIQIKTSQLTVTYANYSAIIILEYILDG